MNRHTTPGGGYQGYTGYEDPRKAEKEAMAKAMGLPTSAGAAPNYDKLDRDSAYYQSMLQTGMDYSPTNFTGGLARLANAFVGRQGLNRVEEREAEYAEQEAAAAQAKQDKFADMARMMAGPDATPQALAMAQFDPEGFMSASMEAQAEANKPYTLGKDEIRYGAGGEEIARGVEGAPNRKDATIRDPNNPNRFVEVQYDPADPQGTMEIIGEAEPRKALVENKIGLGDGGIDELTVFERKQDELYADILAQWNTGGGSDTLKNLTNLRGVADRLEAGDENLTGYIIGNTPDWVLAGLNPEALDAKDLIEEVVQRNLRIILGAQFTEKEGARLIARAYNSRLPEEVNARRVRSLVQMIEGRAQQLQSLNAYVTDNRTGAGWQGNLQSVDQMLAELDQISGGTNSPTKGQKRPRWNPDTQSFDE